MRDSETTRLICEALDRYGHIGAGCGPQGNSGVPLGEYPTGEGADERWDNVERTLNRYRQSGALVPQAVSAAPFGGPARVPADQPALPTLHLPGAPPDLAEQTELYRARFAVTGPTLGQVAEWQRLRRSHAHKGEPPQCRTCRGRDCNLYDSATAALIAAGILEDGTR